ncbi:MAG: type III-B CRISPR module RAMP protein Cmr4 [Chloroflexia bacterium]|nr:type III-B CRISPR module RAMP protein Cmr4 [Chloroflexia bacterium]
MSNGNIYQSQRYYGLALDPIHVGTGGYRLGRVDLSILREPGDNLPKIPGSSISGTSRAYTAMRTNKYRRQQTIGQTQNNTPIIRTVSCAGKGGDFGEEHCCERDCPVCIPYGFSNGRTRQSLQGMAQFFDARLLFFPVHSMVGPVWITAPGALRQAGMADPPELASDQARPAAGLRPAANSPLAQLNLGWLLLQCGDELDTEAIATELPDLPHQDSAIKEILGRLVLISDELFSKVVNDNLEVRTSVAIDPATGAADDKALFTFEALPRAALLFFDVVYNNPGHFQVAGVPLTQDIAWVRQQVERGLALTGHLGLGGMNSRGLGRMKVLNLEEKNHGN